LNYAVDDGMVVYINGKEAARYQMNNGTVSYNTFASTHAAGNPDNGSLILPSNLFKKGTNVIAVEVHNNNGTSTDIHFDAALYASVLSTDDNIYSEEEEFILPAGNNFSLVAYYEPLTVEEEQQNHQVPVRINEISADNGIYVNANYFERNDWIELYNTTSRQVDVAGMYLTDKLDQPQKFQIPANEKVNTIIPPYGYLIIWADKLDPIQQLHASFKLDKEGGSVMLTSADEAWSDTLFYPAHAEYESVGLYPDGGTNMYVMPYPTIAATNEMSSLAQFFIESELSSSVTPMDAPERQPLYATYADGQLIVRGKQDAAISIALYTVSGQRVTQTTAILTAGQATLPVGNLSSGIYIVRLNDSQGNTHNQKMVVR
jgi:hypothetical protein